MHTILALLLLFAPTQNLPGLAGRRPLAPSHAIAPADDGVVTEVIPLRFAAAADAAQRLRVPKSPRPPVTPRGVQAELRRPAGISEVIADPRTNSLLIVGTQQAVTALKAKIQRLDVQARQIKIQMKVLRFDFDADGSWDMRVVGAPTIMTLDNIAASLSAQGDADAYSVDVTPHLNPNGTISLTGGLTAGREHTAFRRDLPARTRRILAGVSDAHSVDVRKTAATGRIPPATGEPFTVYYLQIVSVEEVKGH